MIALAAPPRIASLATGLVAALAAAALLGGCGGETDPAASVAEADTTIPISTETAEDPVDPTPSTDPVTPAPTIESTAPAAPATDPALDPEPETPAAPRPYATMALTPAASGSNPLLAWDPVDGASLYRLVVLDPDGEPYWAWSGTATSVNVGGNAAETTVGARIYADMSWQVSAYDDAGVPIAFSEPSQLSR